VTVVIPTRNRSGHLAQTLDAVLGQGDVGLEVVVVDEASTDGTADAVRGRGDDRIRVVRNETPLGASGARNAGLATVDTEWVAFCDDDDLWAPDKLAAQLAELGSVAGARWSCVGDVSFTEELRIVHHARPPASGQVLELLVHRNVVPGGGSSVLAHAELVREVGAFRPDQLAEDWDLWVRLAEASPVASVDRPLVAYRIWPSSSRDTAAMGRAWREIRERYRHLAVGPGIGDAEVDQLRWLAKQELRAGHRLRAAGHFARAGRRDPRQLPRMGLALAAPAWAERRGTRRSEAEVPEVWRAEAEAWLRPLLSAGA
jgi:glycosyltransferase involved in cell wall biosynthesis